VRLDDELAVRGKRVIAVEDGPTVTHGGMAYGAAHVAAKAAAAATIVDPRPFATSGIARVYEQYPHIGAVLPAVGYGPAQLAELQRTLDACPADVVVSGTPIDLAALIAIGKPIVRARYAFAEAGEPTLASHVDAFVASLPGYR